MDDQQRMEALQKAADANRNRSGDDQNVTIRARDFCYLVDRAAANTAAKPAPAGGK